MAIIILISYAYTYTYAQVRIRTTYTCQHWHRLTTLWFIRAIEMLTSLVYPLWPCSILLHSIFDYIVGLSICSMVMGFCCSCWYSCCGSGCCCCCCCRMPLIVINVPSSFIVYQPRDTSSQPTSQPTEDQPSTRTRVQKLQHNCTNTHHFFGKPQILMQTNVSRMFPMGLRVATVRQSIRTKRIVITVYGKLSTR